MSHYYTKLDDGSMIIFQNAVITDHIGPFDSLVDLLNHYLIGTPRVDREPFLCTSYDEVMEIFDACTSIYGRKLPVHTSFAPWISEHDTPWWNVTLGFADHASGGTVIMVSADGRTIDIQTLTERLLNEGYSVNGRLEEIESWSDTGPDDGTIGMNDDWGLATPLLFHDEVMPQATWEAQWLSEYGTMPPGEDVSEQVVQSTWREDWEEEWARQERDPFTRFWNWLNGIFMWFARKVKGE